MLSDVRGIIAEQLGKELDAVQQDSKFADLGADSLDTVEIMMALEEKFGFEVSLTLTSQPCHTTDCLRLHLNKPRLASKPK